eukprot:SAG31_NODE_9640_length_1247_cov_2.047038_2_plen_83_part_01
MVEEWHPDNGVYTLMIKAPAAESEPAADAKDAGERLASCLCGCDAKIVLTERNETFIQLCKRIPGVKDHVAEYYKYLLQRHNY